MADGRKLNETRGWSTNYRGDLVICSAMRKPTRLDFGGDLEAYKNAMALPYGCALCVVRLWAVVPTEALRLKKRAFNKFRGTGEFELGDYSPGRFAWMTTDLRPLAKPVPVIGRQGFFFLPKSVAAAVRENLPNGAFIDE